MKKTYSSLLLFGIGAVVIVGIVIYLKRKDSPLLASIMPVNAALPVTADGIATFASCVDGMMEINSIKRKERYCEDGQWTAWKPIKVTVK